MPNQYDVIVVGAGIGGATCAALLQHRGIRTLLVDKNAVPGGKAVTVEKAGFRYELWPICGGPSLHSQFAAVLAELGMEDEVRLLTPGKAAMLLYRHPGSDSYEGRVSAAVPTPDGPMAIVEVLRLQAESLPEVARLFTDLLQLTPDEIDRLDDGAVAGIVTDQGRFDAPIVVSNAGIQPTVLRLIGAEHFDRSYVSYVRGLVPSWAIMGIRYFLDQPFFEYPMYIAFSDQSYVDTKLFLQMKAGHVPDELMVFNVVPAVYDPSLAPPNKQCALVGTICSPDPDLSYQEAMWQKLDAMVTRLWPGIEACVTSKERYSTRHVSSMTRDAVLPGQGGECIGLGQIVGQCGKQKPAARAPLRGLFFVGCDAGSYGCGTHQAADSGVKVATLVEREHRIRATAYEREAQLLPDSALRIARVTWEHAPATPAVGHRGGLLESQ